MQFKEEISIWFFIGICLLVNGVLITCAGLYEWFIVPPATPVVLYELHANVWWGGVLLIAGVFYSWRFRPRQLATNVKADVEERYQETHAS